MADTLEKKITGDCMTTLLLSEGDPLWTIPGGGAVVELYGSAGVDSLALAQGAQVNFGTSFNAGNDNIYFQGSSTDYLVSNSGATVTLTDSQGAQIELPAGVAGQQLVFADGALDLQIDSGRILIGDQAVTSTGTAVSTTVDLSETSGDQFDGTQDGGETTGDYTIASADQGTVDNPVSLDASGDGFKFTDNASVLGHVEISNFINDDVIEISGVSAGDYNFSNLGEDVSITYNNSGTMNIITLVGVVDAGDLVYDEISFEASIGFDAVNYA